MKLVLTSLDDEQKAEEIIDTLLQEKLAACVNLYPCKSRYWWKNKIEKNNEVVVWIKTKDSLVEEVMERVKQLHPYDTPVIEVINVEKINPSTKTWIEEVCKK